jgi:hypothetical protein
MYICLLAPFSTAAVQLLVGDANSYLLLVVRTDLKTQQLNKHIYISPTKVGVFSIYLDFFFFGGHGLCLSRSLEINNLVVRMLYRQIVNLPTN